VSGRRDVERDATRRRCSHATVGHRGGRRSGRRAQVL
jgi:hypothetical protein